MRRSIALAALIGVAATQWASAAPITFKGDGGTATRGDAAKARKEFLAALHSGVGTEDFESFAGGSTAPLHLSFPGSSGSIGATLTGSGSVQTAPNPNLGVYNTTRGGSNYFHTDPPNSIGDFHLAFDSGISAFGFYGTDLGDTGSDLQITLVGGGPHVQFRIPVAGQRDGELLFWGFIDRSNAYTQIAITHSRPDRFGFDDMVIADSDQILAAPAPGTLGLVALLGIPILLVRRRRRARGENAPQAIHHDCGSDRCKPLRMTAGRTDASCCNY